MKKLILSTALIAVTATSAMAQYISIGDFGINAPAASTINVFLVEPATRVDGAPKTTSTTSTVQTSGWFECSVIPGSFSAVLPNSRLSRLPDAYTANTVIAGTTTSAAITDRTSLEITGGTATYKLLHNGYNKITTEYKVITAKNVDSLGYVRAKSVAGGTAPAATFYGGVVSGTATNARSVISEVSVPNHSASEFNFVVDSLSIYAQANTRLNEAINLPTLTTDVRVHYYTTCSKV